MIFPRFTMVKILWLSVSFLMLNFDFLVENDRQLTTVPDILGWKSRLVSIYPLLYPSMPPPPPPVEILYPTTTFLCRLLIRKKDKEGERPRFALLTSRDLWRGKDGRYLLLVEM